MNYPCAELCLFLLTFTFMAQHSSCFSNFQVKKTHEQKPQLVLPRVTCSARRIKAVFSALVKSNVRVRDASGAAVPVSQDEESCGVRLSREKDQSLLFLSRYDSCYAHTEKGVQINVHINVDIVTTTDAQGSKVVVPLQVQLTGQDKWFQVDISCPLIKRNSERDFLPTPFPENCDTERALRVDCGERHISIEACYKLGCCYDARDSTCYYRLNDCSLDGHFVFSVKTTDTDVLIDPSSLIIKDQPECFPVVTTPVMAVFKVGVTDCGAKMRVDGDVLIYEVEVEELRTRSLANRSPFSLQVQCEYDAADLKRAADLRPLLAVTNPPRVAAVGTIRVQMRIATDESFTSFFPEDQLPLTLPLRDATYVEVSIAQPSPDPALSLRVRDCFAYPESRHSVWMLLYDGCPNPSDKMRSSVPVDNQGRAKSHSQVRRFDVKTFAFLDPDTGHPSVEEIYFYCWVEICPADDDCAQSCAIVSSESERQRREAVSEYDQLVSLGPLLLEQNNTKVDDSPCAKQQKFRMAAYLLSGVGAALILVLLFTAWPCIKKCRRSQVQQVETEQCE